jgi:hypothetical protein
MEAEGEDYFASMNDTRNVRAYADCRGKTVGMVTKAYSHKAIKKILYTKSEKQQKKKEAQKREDEEREKEKLNEPLDDISEKKLRKQKEKQAKQAEKVQKRLEKIKLSKSETLKNGIKH